MPGRIAWILVIGILIVAMALGVMHIRNQPAILIYDEAWAEKAGEAAMICAPEMKASCQKQAIDGQNEFKDILRRAYGVESECKGVQFLIEPKDRSGDKALRMAEQQHYWRLRVDLRPGLQSQSATMGIRNGQPETSVEGDAAFIMAKSCEITLNNGLHIYW
jgi:hypothetical protein